MPSETDAARRWLDDILHHIDLAGDFVSCIRFDAFTDNTMRLYAVARCLEIISEASRRIPDELKNRHPSMPWREMAAAGNVYRHDYEDVAARTVWRTRTRDLPLLRAVNVQELAAFES